jgi:cold shock CspA family protein
MTGAILRVHQDRGFAILRSDAGDKYFAHASAFTVYDAIDRVEPGMRVVFQEARDEGRELPRAGRVEVLDLPSDWSD